MINLIILPLLIIALAIIIFINSKYKRTNFYKNQFFDVEKFVHLSSCVQADTKFDIINVGSTQPYFAFDYTGLTITGMNWAVRPQTFEYDFRILQQFHGFLKEQAFVLIPVCPFSFFVYRFSYNSINYKYYTFLEPESVNNYSLKTRRLYIDYPVITAGRNLKRLIRDVPPDRRLEIDSNPMNSEQMKNDAKRWMDIWLTQFSLGQIEVFSLSPKNEDAIQKNITILHEMIDFCLERGYRPVIMTLPASKELTGLFPQHFIDEYIQGNIKKANPRDVPVLNYWNNERFMASEYFCNAFLFNVKGRKEFTNTAINDLKEIAW
jgi:hypothetical protein